MAKTVSLTKDGKIIYEGLLTSKEKASVDEILNALQQEIPVVEDELHEEFKDAAMYCYHLGLFLGQLLEKYEIPVYERRRFWDEIKNFATKEKRKRNEGKNATTRSFYHQCYMLSTLDKETVKKLKWKQWQSLFDRQLVREDERLFEWIRRHEDKVNASLWREFEKSLNLYLKTIDTSVFTDEELFEIYDSILAMSEYWLTNFKIFAEEHPNSQKLASGRKTVWSKKFYAKCFELKKQMRVPTITPEVCKIAYEIVMK